MCNKTNFKNEHADPVWVTETHTRAHAECATLVITDFIGAGDCMLG